MNNDEEGLIRKLADALHTALADAVANAHRKCPGEHFYAYLLYTLPQFDYAVLLFNTEERLARMGGGPADVAMLRWLPPDWECAQNAEAQFEPVNDVLRRLTQIQSHSEKQACRRRQVFNVFMNVLKLLDSQGMFGTGAIRERVLVNVMWGDQDVRAHVESARELNPRASYLLYARDALPSLLAGEKEIESSRSTCRNEALARIRNTIAQVERDLATGLDGLTLGH